MIVLTDPNDIRSIQHDEIRILALRRFQMLSAQPEDITDLCTFVVVEQGDSAADLSAELGFDILRNRYDGVRFDEGGSKPFEILEEHLTCYEVVFVISDDGYGVEMFVPKLPEIDAALLTMCSMHATPSQEEPAS